MMVVANGESIHHVYGAVTGEIHTPPCGWCYLNILHKECSRKWHTQNFRRLKFLEFVTFIWNWHGKYIKMDVDKIWFGIMYVYVRCHSSRLIIIRILKQLKLFIWTCMIYEWWHFTSYPWCIFKPTNGFGDLYNSGIVFFEIASFFIKKKEREKSLLDNTYTWYLSIESITNEHKD